MKIRTKFTIVALAISALAATPAVAEPRGRGDHGGKHGRSDYHRGPRGHHDSHRGGYHGKHGRSHYRHGRHHHGSHPPVMIRPPIPFHPPVVVRPPTIVPYPRRHHYHGSHRRHGYSQGGGVRLHTGRFGFHFRF